VVGCRKGGHQKGRKLSHWGYDDTPFPLTIASRK